MLLEELEKRSLFKFKKKNQTVFLRVDNNVPLSKHGDIVDFTKIVKILPTIKFLIALDCKIVLATHLGSPVGHDKSLSTLCIYRFLKEKFEDICGIIFLEHKKNVLDHKHVIQSTSFKTILVMENLRFFPEEKDNNQLFAKDIASMFDIYVNDAFACCHRHHASIVSVPKFLESYCGPLLLEESRMINELVFLNSDSRLTILGGSKVSTKISLIKALCPFSKFIVLGGGLANSYLGNLGHALGETNIETCDIEEVEIFAKKNGCKIVLPTDFIALDSKTGLTRNTGLEDIRSNEKIFDIGTQSVSMICQLINQCSSVVWNGPLGMFEDNRFCSGTFSIVKCIAKTSSSCGISSIAGGGETIQCIGSIKEDIGSCFTYISTGGGAMLRYIESGGYIPGIIAILQQL